MATLVVITCEAGEVLGSAVDRTSDRLATASFRPILVATQAA